MTRRSTTSSIALAIAAWSLTAGSVAQASTVSMGSASPLVALSAFGTDQSRAALGTASSTAVVAAAAQDSYEGGGGANLWPLFIGLGVIVAAFFLLDDEVLGDEDDFDIIVPVSPD